MLILSPEDIKPLQKWTEEEIETARKDMFRFGWVARGDDGISLWEEKPVWDDVNKWWDIDIYQSIVISESTYPSLQPGECVALEEIAGGK